MKMGNKRFVDNFPIDENHVPSVGDMTYLHH